MSKYADVYRESQHRSRKQRRCEGCWYKTETNPIKVGDPYWSIFTVSEGEAGSVAICDVCHAFLESEGGKKFMKDAEDGWGRGDLLEARKWAAMAEEADPHDDGLTAYPGDESGLAGGDGLPV